MLATAKRHRKDDPCDRMRLKRRMNPRFPGNPMQPSADGRMEKSDDETTTTSHRPLIAEICWLCDSFRSGHHSSLHQSEAGKQRFLSVWDRFEAFLRSRVEPQLSQDDHPAHPADLLLDRCYSSFLADLCHHHPSTSVGAAFRIQALLQEFLDSRANLHL